MPKAATIVAPPGAAPGDGDAAPCPQGILASEERYRRLFETAQDGILILDADTGRITDVNPFLEELLGYSHDEFIGRELWEIGPVRDIAASQDAMRTLQGREYIRYEDLPLETKSKRRVQVEFVSNVYEEGGRRVIQCNVRDITARRAAEREAEMQTELLRGNLAEMLQRDGEMVRGSRLNDLLHACGTQADAFEVLAHVAGDVFDGESGFLAVLRPADRSMEVVTRWGTPLVAPDVFGVDDCWAMRRGHPHEVPGANAGLVCRHLRDQPAAGSVCVPLAVQGETLGVLTVVGTGAGPWPGPLRLRVALTTGESVKLALSNLRLRDALREQATVDPLTGLHNRRYLDEGLAREVHRAHRSKSPLCVAILDLDHFKSFNDTAGHDAGDLLLREVGKILSGNVRKSDIACRYGGEEFVVVLPDSSLADARVRLDHIRTLIGSAVLRHGGRDLGPVTISAGLALAHPGGSTPAELLRTADEALYVAKQSGRDRVVEHPPAR